MGVPATQGKLCMTLKEMEIGDYIRCTYTALTANVAGSFADLGGTGTATELPIMPGDIANGYFYFLKVDKGFLIADRAIQKNISWMKIAQKRYYTNESMVRFLTQNEFTKYIVNGDCGGSIAVRDDRVWHDPHTVDGYGFHSINTWLMDLKSGTARSAWDLTGNKFNEMYYYSVYQVYPYGSGSLWGTCYVPIYADANLSVAGIWASLSWVQYAFRPALEYIDNAKSKTFWY